MHVSPVGQLREHWGVGVALLAFTGLVALGLSMTLLDEHADAFAFFGIALLLYALLIMSSRLPESWVGSWVAKRLDAWVESHGAGWSLWRDLSSWKRKMRSPSCLPSTWGISTGVNS